MTRDSGIKSAQQFSIDDLPGLNFDGMVKLMRAIYGRKCIKGTCADCDARRAKAR
jgi:hypothetical protein